MSTRLALYDWIARHDLDRERGRALFRAAGFASEPAAVARSFWPAVAIAGAAMGGLGLLLWLAANWQDLGRMGRFALLQGALVVLCAGAAWLPRARAPLSLLAFCCIGGLFAYFGQTYQTGADPWQLFALWAVLALPLCFAARSDVLWAPWALVAAVGIALWMHANTGHRWRVQPGDLDIFLVAWLAGVLLVAALSPAAARVTGAGVWALRTAGTLVVVLVTLAAIGALLHDRVAPHYALALLVLGAGAVALAVTRWFDLFLLSAVALALNTLLVGGLAHLMFANSSGDATLRLMFIGLVAAGLLAGTVSLVTRLAKRHG